MRTILQSIPVYLITLVEGLRDKLYDEQFIARHRVRPEDFTRDRQLTFPVVMLLVLQKTIKSIQRHLNDFLEDLAGGGLFETATAGAWTHARAKLKHTAFVELNQQVVLPLVNEQRQELKYWRGHRLFGHDSSLLRLPQSPQCIEQFGLVEITNQGGPTGTAYPEARMAVLYDLLNRIGIDARLEPSKVGEVSLAIEQVVHLRPGDVVLNDRGFTGYRYLAEHIHRGVQVTGRCSSGSFFAAQELFRLDRGGCSQIVKLFAPADQKAELKALGLPLELIVRFVSLRLPDGKLEVLVTSLLDEEAYPTEEFLKVYHWRWGHETYYHVLKSHLELENFSGQTAEAVRQDYHAAVLLCNLESLLIRPAQQELAENQVEGQQPKELNHADTFHTLKSQLLGLLDSDLPAEAIIQKMQRIFLTRPLSVPPPREVPPRRKKQSFNRSYHFQRRVKKAVF